MTPTPRQILDRYADIYQKALRDSLLKNKVQDRLTSGKLFSSIIAYTRVFGQNVEMVIKMDEYWKFIDKGVSGTQRTFPTEFRFKKKNLNQNAMLKMIANGGIKVEQSNRQKKKTKSLKNKIVKKSFKQRTLEQKRKSLAWLLGRSIAKYGIEPNKFATKVFESNLIDNLKKDITEAVGREIKIQISIK